jgi:dimethylargininase
MFTYAIVRTPAKSMIDGITTANLGVPDYEKALRQHQAYVEALRACGLTIITLPAAEDFPDSCFVEDTALLTKRCAIIARPGAPTRQGEEAAVLELLPRYFDHIESIVDPGTIEPGDIMMVDDHCYIGLSERTNAEGASQMIEYLETAGYSGSTLSISEALHLKSSVAYLENNNLVVTGELVDRPEFGDFNRVEIEQSERRAANCVWINSSVLIAAGHPHASEKIDSLGYSVIELDVSEFEKLDGGLSCLSLRF